jgi:hypothetical protein
MLRPPSDALKVRPRLLLVSPIMQAAFQSTKTALVAVTTLVHTSLSAVVSLAVDVTDSHVRAVLQLDQNSRDIVL